MKNKIIDSRSTLNIYLKNRETEINDSNIAFQNLTEQLNELFNKSNNRDFIFYSGKDEIIRIIQHIIRFSDKHEEIRKDLLSYFDIKEINLNEEYEGLERITEGFKTTMETIFDEKFNEYFDIVKVRGERNFEQTFIISPRPYESKPITDIAITEKLKHSFIFEDNKELLFNYPLLHDVILIQKKCGYKVEDNSGNFIVLRKCEIELY